MDLLFSGNRMIVMAEDYYGYRTDHKSPKEIRDLVTLAPDGPLPAGAWPPNEAQKHGVVALLVNPNRYPLYQTLPARMYRLALIQFDMTTCGHDHLHDWKHQKDLVIRYFAMIYDLVPNEIIKDHTYVGRKHSCLDKKYAYLKNLLAAILIHRAAYGWHQRLSHQLRLSNQGKLNSKKLVHNYFVRMMVYYLLTEMNPNLDLEYEKIMTADVCDVSEHIVRTAVNKGIWSESIVLPRASRPSDHPDCYNAEHKDVCKGVPYPFARLCSLVVFGFRYSKLAHMSHMTLDEERKLYNAHDPIHCIPRYPPSWNRFTDYGSYHHLR